MKVLQGFIVSGLAAVGGSYFGAWIAFGDPFAWQVTLYFTFLGSFLILLPGYAALRGGWPRVACYVSLLPIGSLFGGLMLSWALWPGVAYGAAFGAWASILWALLHWLSRYLFRHGEA